MKDAYKCSQELHKSNITSWFSFVKKLLEVFEIKQEVKHFGQYKFLNISSKLIHTKYISNWYASQNKASDGKLFNYVKFKQNFGYENYLSLIKNFDFRRSICKLRISAHKLQIEVGRFSNIPRNERICKKCSSGCVEDEIHFLTNCENFKSDRDALFDFVCQRIPNFSILDNQHKFIYLLNCEDNQVLNAVGKFIKVNMS